MAEIIYFGTNGCFGHYPIGIDKTLTGAEYEIWRECDNETWINNIRKNPGRHLIKHHGEVYTNYGVPFSVDDDRGGSSYRTILERHSYERRNRQLDKE